MIDKSEARERTMMQGRQVRRADISLAEVFSNAFGCSEQAKGKIPRMKSWVVGKLSGLRGLLDELECVNSILVQYY